MRITTEATNCIWAMWPGFLTVNLEIRRSPNDVNVVTMQNCLV